MLSTTIRRTVRHFRSKGYKNLNQKLSWKQEIESYIQCANTSFIVDQLNDEVITRIVDILELHDKGAAGHSSRVAYLATNLVKALGFDGDTLINIHRGALLHDIGKLGIPSQILQKQGTLTEEEWKIIKHHPTIARDLLENFPFLKLSQEIPYLHHEKWDGSGYPLGMKEEEIPITARIFAVVDVWDSLRSDRPYRSARSEKHVRRYISGQSGKHFDPKVVELFFQVMYKNERVLVDN